MNITSEVGPDRTIRLIVTIAESEIIKTSITPRALVDYVMGQRPVSASDLFGCLATMAREQESSVQVTIVQLFRELQGGGSQLLIVPDFASDCAPLQLEAGKPEPQVVDAEWEEVAAVRPVDEETKER